MAGLNYTTLYSEGLGDDLASAAFDEVLVGLRRDGGDRTLGHWIGGREYLEGDLFERHDPARSGQRVARGHAADRGMIDRAVREARRALPGWRQTSWVDRAQLLAKGIDAIRERRVELAAVTALETGKARADAFGEVDEAVAILELFRDQVVESDGYNVKLRSPTASSTAEVVLMPYGVFGIIAPFNFPVAISFTMAAAALVAGNTVVFKPSALTPAGGQAFYDLLTSIGLPDGVFNLIQGGAETGAALSEAQIDGLAFTGSAHVGHDLIARLGRPPYARPVLAEMGGKSPTIVSANVDDLDVAALAVARSAFGMTAQKCNACSRVVVVDGVYDQFVERLAQAASDFSVGDPADPSVFTGPVIKRESVDRFHRAVATARADGRVVVGGGEPSRDGHFVDLTVVDGLPHGHELTREELFVPVLSVVRVSDFDAAIAEANAVRYGLAAGVFSDDEKEREQFLDEIEAGILFVNSPGGGTTGVWPGSQTMSGWKASGATGKGGFGPWYLQQFAREQSRTIYS